MESVNLCAAFFFDFLLILTGQHHQRTFRHYRKSTDWSIITVSSCISRYQDDGVDFEFYTISRFINWCNYSIFPCRGNMFFIILKSIKYTFT